MTFPYKILASSGPSPEELKKPVDLSSPSEIIQYKDTVYAIRFGELRNRGLDYHDEIVLMCQGKGLEDPAFFGRNCMLCGNATTNMYDLIGNSEEPVILNSMPKVNCTYQPEKDIQVAASFSGKKQEQFYAVMNRCAFDDSLIQYLADNGQLDDAKAELDFNFKSITSFDPKEKIPEEYLVKTIERKLPKESQRPNRFLRFLKSLGWK